MKTVFYNETTNNGRIQVMTTESLKGQGIKNLGGNYIVDHNNELNKGNINYWVTLQAFENLKSMFNMVRVCF